MRNPQRLYARRSAVSKQIEEKVRTAWRHAEAGRNVRPPSREYGWATKLSEIPCRVSNIARGGSDPVHQPAQIGEALTALQERPRVIPRVRSPKGDPRNDSGVEIPGWSTLLHNTPALVLANGPCILHLWIRGWRRLFLRILSAEQTTSFRLGGEAKFFSEPKCRSS